MASSASVFESSNTGEFAEYASKHLKAPSVYPDNYATSISDKHSKSPALEFVVENEERAARAAIMTLPHGPVETPVFMPVGTQGSIKGLTSEQVDAIGFQIILANTYHMELNPGADLLTEVGGLHRLMNWKRNMLTDSGGFQMVSLVKLSEITEDGVTFQSPRDGSMMLLTPERSIGIQNAIGADIIMQLDDVISSVHDDEDRFETAVYRTVRWLDRCQAAHQRPLEQNLFPIVQGGLSERLRLKCLELFNQRDHRIPGYAIGGLAGGEDKNHFWRMVKLCCDHLPRNKPRCLSIV